MDQSNQNIEDQAIDSKVKWLYVPYFEIADTVPPGEVKSNEISSGVLY